MTHRRLSQREDEVYELPFFLVVGSRFLVVVAVRWWSSDDQAVEFQSLGEVKSRLSGQKICDEEVTVVTAAAHGNLERTERPFTRLYLLRVSYVLLGLSVLSKFPCAAAET